MTFTIIIIIMLSYYLFILIEWSWIFTLITFRILSHNINFSPRDLNIVIYQNPCFALFWRLPVSLKYICLYIIIYLFIYLYHLLINNNTTCFVKTIFTPKFVAESHKIHDTLYLDMSFSIQYFGGKLNQEEFSFFFYKKRNMILYLHNTSTRDERQNLRIYKI